MDQSSDPVVIDVGNTFDDVAKNAPLIIQGYIASHSVIFQFELHLGNTILSTEKVYMRNFKPEVIKDLIENDLIDRFLAVVDFDNPQEMKAIKLYLTKLLPSQGICPNCKKVMYSKSITRHLKTCVTGDFCPICQCQIEGDLSSHINMCNRVDYSCRVCQRSFNTASARKSHEKKCRMFQDGSPSKRQRHNVDDTAINGLFRIVKVNITPDNPDYEGVLLDRVDQIEDILRSRMETGLKFYIGMKLIMKPLVGDETKIANFQTSSSILLKSAIFSEEIQMHTEALVKKVEEYVRLGSGWVIDSVKALQLMMTKYSPMVGGTYFSLPKEYMKMLIRINFNW